jgi:hypothetical protein
MSDVRVFGAGGYRYAEGVFQYSAGVAAEPGFEIERAQFQEPVPIAAGFAAVESHLKAIGRPTTAFCACELRSPGPLSDQDFLSFNRDYITTLERWGLYRDGANPVARTNVCPQINPPSTPSLLAFCYTVPASGSRPGTFVVAGGGEAPEGKPNYRDYIVRRGDLTAEGLREKVRFVVVEMERRLTALGFGWRDATSAQAYTVHDVGRLLIDEVWAHGAAPRAVAWHYTRPPIADLEFEMDVRRTAREILIQQP